MCRVTSNLDEAAVQLQVALLNLHSQQHELGRWTRANDGANAPFPFQSGIAQTTPSLRMDRKRALVLALPGLSRDKSTWRHLIAIPPNPVKPLIHNHDPFCGHFDVRVSIPVAWTMAVIVLRFESHHMVIHVVELEQMSAILYPVEP